MKIEDLAKTEESAREVQLLVDLMHYFKLYCKYMDESDIEAFSSVIEFIGRQEVE